MPVVDGNLESNVDITVVDNAAEDRFEALAPDGTVVGVAEYSRQGDVVLMNHVEVLPAYEGQGIASRLTTAALDELRGQGVKIVPRCPYVLAFLPRHPEYADLVAEAGS
jgi:predicted GNAT family acetyltransferase